MPSTPSPTHRALRRDVGALLAVGFEGDTLGDATRALLIEHHIGQVVLFRRNCRDAAQIAALTRDLAFLGEDGAPTLIAVDQEGGPVARLRGIATDFPAMGVLGATGDEGLAHAYGAALAEELTALGISASFAPVADVDSNPENPVIGARAFGPDPALVARMVAAQMRGMEAGGLLSCVKHFPGHGDTRADSHQELPVLPHALSRLDEVELVPFRAALKAGVPMVMTAHVLFPALDAERPATLSPEVVDGLLRNRLGYQGVVATDDLEMAAIVDGPGVAEAAVLAMRAGVDLALVCHRPERQLDAWEALLRAGERSSADRERIAQAAQRVRALRGRIDPGLAVPHEEAAAALRAPDLLALADEIARRGAAALDAQGRAPRAPDATRDPTAQALPT